MQSFGDKRSWKTIGTATMLVALFGLNAACGEDTTPDTGPQATDEVTEIEDFVLTDPALLKEGAPPNSELPAQAKADEILPDTFEVRDTQSSVKSQGRRGVCSIFSTVALMEHLYIAEGTITDPDFSEQYLQWSAKFEVRSFPNTAGSNASSNLQAINRFGIVEEALWPYEPSQWGTSDDEECTGDDDQPTRCYTNGEPPAEAQEGEKWFLPSSRFVSTRPRDLKAFIKRTGQAVIVGGDFYYQAWNHGASNLPTNSEYKRKGYVLYPNDEDIEDSSGDRRAGHSILVIGWDDNLEVQRMDANGEAMVDENGNPVVEKGFYIFKNSWGTSAFGTEHPSGNGYGYLSQRYVEEFLRARAADLPELELEPRVEICGDGFDNDDNGVADCEDPVCEADASCQGNEASFTTTPGVEIPDNNEEGIVTSLAVEDDREIKTMNINVKISHSFRGDLNIILTHPDSSIAIVHEASGEPGQDLEVTVPVQDFNGKSAAGEWQLHVWDDAAADTGTVDEWTLNITF